MLFRLRLLGSPDLTRPDGAQVLSVLAQPKRLALLAYLVADSARHPSRDELIGVFWPDRDEDDARNALSQALHYLRRSLAEGVIISHGDGALSVDHDLLECDVVEFEQSVASGDLEKALELYRGDLAEDLYVSGCPEFDHWRDQRSATLRSSAVEAAATLSSRREEEGVLPAAIESARRAVDLAPTDESHVRTLMRLQASSGDRGAAVVTYEVFERHFRVELELEPSPETLSLLREIREASAEVGLASASDSSPSPTLTTLVVSDPTQPVRWKRWAAAGVAAALVSAIGLGLALGNLGGSGTDGESVRRIAVLPFDNFSEETERAYIANGLTEEITSQLGKIAAFQVMSTSGVQRLMAAGRTLEEIGEELGVGWVVEGSVRQAGDQLRVTARLIDVRTDEHVWSGDYDGALADIFDVQRTVAVEIAATLDATLSPDEARRLDRRPTENLAAYALFERASGISTAPDQVPLKIQMLEEVIALDSSFARAYADLGRTHMWISLRTGVRADSGEALARTAIRLDPDSEDAYFVLADNLAYTQGRLSEAKIAYLRALELNPSHNPSILDLSDVLVLLGSYDESLYWAERGFAIGSSSSNAHYHVAEPLLGLMSERHLEEFLTRATERFPDQPRIQVMWLFFDAFSGRDEAAVQRARRFLPLFQNSSEPFLAAAEVLFLLRTDDAGAALESLNRSTPERRLWMSRRTARTAYAHTLLKAGFSQRAESLFDESVAFNRQALAAGDELFGIPYEVAAIAAVRGSTEEALDWLERAYEAGLRQAALVELDPMLDALRDEPRFEELIARIRRDVEAMRAQALSPDGVSMFRDSLSVR